MALAAAHFAAEPGPRWEGGGKDGQMIARVFFSADFSPRQFSKASLQHGERRHIKDSWSCRQLGFQKRTAKGYLRTCCKAFFTPWTPLLAARHVQQARVGGGWWVGVWENARLPLPYVTFADLDFSVG